jgi:Tol biopolymer transport system component/serine/threonine protein kinase
MTLFAGQLLQGRYRIVRELGRGGMGQVYLGDDLRLAGRPVALKILPTTSLSPAEFRERWALLQREAQVLARLNHPGIAGVFDCFAEGGVACIVMEYAPGETLAARLERLPGRHLSPGEALSIGLGLCELLTYLHSRQPPVVFRDLKPSNVILTPDGGLKLIDFGIARFFKPGQTHDTHSFGTPGYTAPEQYGLGQTGPTADIYSLGVVLHEMLTGHDPTERIPFLPLDPPGRLGIAVSPQVDAAIVRATDPLVANRFPDAQSLAEALRAPPVPPAQPPSRSRAPLLAVGVTALAVVALVAWFLVLRPEPPVTLSRALVTEIAPSPAAPELTSAPATAPPPAPTKPATVQPIPTKPAPTFPATAAPEPTSPPEPTRLIRTEPAPLSGADETQMTSDPANEYVARLAPGQEQVVYMTDAFGGWQLQVMDLATEAAQRLTDDAADYYHPAYSPDGARIVYASNVSGNWEIYTIDPNGGAPQRLTTLPGAEQYPTFSPDGERILFMSDQGNGWGVYTMRSDGSEMERVIDTAANEQVPSWSPDSKTIVFQSDVAGSQDIWVVDETGDGPRQLTSDVARDATPVVSADGAWVIFETSRSGAYDLYAVPLVGGESVAVHRLTDDGAREMAPSISPDGLWVVYQSDRAGHWDIYRRPWQAP